MLLGSLQVSAAVLAALGVARREAGLVTLVSPPTVESPMEMMMMTTKPLTSSLKYSFKKNKNFSE